jgi:hypothetical protein
MGSCAVCRDAGFGLIEAIVSIAILAVVTVKGCLILDARLAAWGPPPMRENWPPVTIKVQDGWRGHSVKVSSICDTESSRLDGLRGGCRRDAWLILT